MRHQLLLFTMLIATQAPASARHEGVATWLWEVTTQDGDAIVEPGETACVSLWIDFAPDFVECCDESGPQALSVAGFDVLAMSDAEFGVITGWNIDETLTFLAGDQTTSDGTSLFGVFIGQIRRLQGPFVFDDPLWAISFEWAPSTFTGEEIAYATLTSFVEVWVGEWGDPDSVPWQAVDTEIIFEVGCLSDFNGDGALNVLDFIHFTQQFNDDDPATDCNQDGTLNFFDFICFQNVFIGGCP